MTVFIRLIIVLALNLFFLQAVWAEDVCNPPEPSLKEDW